MRSRRHLVLAAAILTLATAPAAHAGSWAAPQIRTVVSKGVMGPSVAAFRPQAALTRLELAQALTVLTQKKRVVVDPGRKVTVQELDRVLVRTLGLGPAARHVREELAAAGLQPPGRVGTETVARLLRLRYNHPAARDALELRPTDPVTRAETAYSLARVLVLGQWELGAANSAALALDLPRLTTWQQRVLRRAVRFVGFPYIWGGTSERPQTLFGVSSRGGFDCSGFVWRVYKTQPYAGAPKLGTTIRGRTTYEMSGEFPKLQRVALARLRPGDLVFFGDRGVRSLPSQVGHAGIYVGGGWFVHSSSQGTTLARLNGWYSDSFAWGRRVLREAGLS